MLPSYSQYSPQGLIPAFSGFSSSGFPGAGAPQLSQGPFGQPGIHGGHAAFGQEFGQAGTEQHFLTTLAQLAQQVAVQSAATQQFSAALLQLTQQLAVQAQHGRLGAAQQFNGAMQPGLGFGQPFGGQIGQGFGQPFGGQGGQSFGQPFVGQGGQIPGVFGGQSVGQPFAGATQGMYGGYNPGFNPLAQQWANPQSWANRPQTIQ